MGKSLKISTWNSRGLVASVPYLRLLCGKNDIVCITEHWLYQNSLTKLEDISTNMNSFGRSSKFSQSEHYGCTKGQGGVAILWDKRLKSITPLCQIQHDRICAVRIQTENSSVINVFCIYMPARGCADDIDIVIDELSAILDNTEYGSYNVLCGDLNADLGKMGGPRSKKVTDNRGVALHNFMLRYDLTAVNLSDIATGPINTHHGPTGETCIDYILTPSALRENCIKCQTLDYEGLNTSDHVPICAELSIAGIPRGCTEGYIPTKLRWDKMSRSSISQQYQEPIGIDLNTIYQNYVNIPPSKDLIDGFLEEIISCIKKHESVVPVTKFRANIKPFWCKELKDLKRVKVNAYREWSNAGKPRDPNHYLYLRNKEAKKRFRHRLKQISKGYDERKIEEAARSAEFDHTHFWRLLKRERDGPKVRTPSVKNQNGKVVHDVDDILKVWQKHFSSLGTPSVSPNYDEDHHTMVTNKIKTWLEMRDIDPFSTSSIEYHEVEKGIKALNGGKAPGLDGITKEHLKNAGPMMIMIIMLLFNMIINLEYIPLNFRRGVQIPLYKGKNASVTDVNNYRGITLLSTFNKLFEVVLWKRMSPWWEESGVLSRLQGACRKGVSCIHTSMLLQETVSTLLESQKKVFVTYLDVSKAFDGVWIDGLFYRLRELGIRGRTWRLLYNSYIDFKCRARVQGKLSDWYTLGCGIHQGGYLSLVKYLAFINSLLVSLETSGLCCMLYNIPVSPLGYADDIATATTSKMKTDRVLEIVYRHSCTWRYKFNPKKSAVLVYGEKQTEHKRNSRDRVYRLGPDCIKEKAEYDHLGLKNTISCENKGRIMEKISKGRRALNAAAGLGLKAGGLTIKACSIIFWSMVIPIITFSSELWVLKDDDIALIESFQRYAGRRIQRFHSRSPNETSYAPLGWLRIEYFIYVKKLLYVRSITILDDRVIYKQLFVERFTQYDADPAKCSLNEFNSPIFDMIRVADIFGVLEDVRNMFQGIKYFSKEQWKQRIWKCAWDIEDQDWGYRTIFFKSTVNLRKTMGSVHLLIWWHLGDICPDMMYQCESMVKIVCKASELKCDMYKHRYNGNDLYCDLCTSYASEDAKHIIMHCTGLDIIRNRMYAQINALETTSNTQIITGINDMYALLLGKLPTYLQHDICIELLRVISRNVHDMYRKVMTNRVGVG